MSHRLPVRSRTQCDEACCDGCPRGISCMNWRLLNLHLKKKISGISGSEATMCLTCGFISPAGGECVFPEVNTM